MRFGVCRAGLFSVGRGPLQNPWARNMNWVQRRCPQFYPAVLARPTSRSPAEAAEGLQANRELNTLGLECTLGVQALPL